MKLEQFLERKNETKRIAVAAAADKEVLIAIDATIRRGIAEVILVGDRKKILAISEENNLLTSECEIVDQPDHEACAKTAVELVRNKEAQVLMKGNLHTALLMHAILNKETGIRESELLNSVCAIESPAFHRLIFLSDPGIVPYPDMKQKVAIINNTVKIVRSLGIENPKVAAICAVENVNPVMPPTMEAAALAMMSQRGQIKHCEVDGPLALDNAISMDVAKTKGVTSSSSVVGRADILLVPNIEAGNVILKSVRFLGGCKTAGLLAGASVPVVMTSRADTAEGKLNSIGMALAAAR